MLSKSTVNKKLLLMKLSFFFYDFGMAPLNPFLQSIARQRGIPVLVIGIIFTFLPIFNVIVRPVTGYLTDRWRCHKLVLLCASLSNAFFTPLIHFTPDFKDDGHAEDLSIMTNWKFWIFVVAVTVRMMLWMVGDVLQDTICLQILGDDKKNYGRNRVWGAIGWGLSTFLVGACVDWYSQDQSEKNYLPAYLIAMVFLICHFTIASRLECNQISMSKSMPTSIVSIVSNTKVFSYLVWAVFAGIFTAYIWYYLFLYIDDLANNYHHERIPYIKTIQGLSVTIECCISEIPTYFLSGYILKRIGHMNAFSIAFALFSLRFFLYSIIQDPLYVLPVEMMNGVTFAMAFIAGVSYAAEIAPIGSEGTLQGLFGMAFHGIGMSFGSFMAGYTFEKVGSSASFRLLSYVAVFAFVVQTSVNKLIDMKKSKKDNADKPSEIATQDSSECL